MKKITQLVNSLSASEVKLIRKYYSISAKIEHNLKIKLFEIALVNKNISDIEAAKLMGKPNNAAFSMLKSRLQEDIMKILIVEGKDKIFNTKYFKTRHKIHFMLLEMDILEDRNLREQATETIMKAKRLATKFELVNDLVVINDIILNGHTIRQGPGTYKKLRSQSISILNKVDDLFWGTDYFKQSSLPPVYKANSTNSGLETTKVAINKLGELSDRSELSRLHYFFLRSKINYHRDILDYKEWKRYALEFLKFIQTNPILNTSDNNGGAHMIITDMYMNTKKYSQALDYAEKGINYFYKDSPNQIFMYELIFLSYFFSKKYEKANEIVTYVKGIKTVKAGTFSYSKWLFFSATVEFALKDYKKVLTTLKRQSFLKTDKTGWALGYRILEIMSLVELENYDALPYRLDTFRKQLSKITKENVSRPKLFLLIMNRLIKDNFDFKLVNQKQAESLQLLRDGKEKYFWNPRSYEVIRFDEWWDTKLKKVVAV